MTAHEIEHILSLVLKILSKSWLSRLIFAQALIIFAGSAAATQLHHDSISNHESVYLHDFDKTEGHTSEKSTQDETLFEHITENGLHLDEDANLTTNGNSIAHEYGLFSTKLFIVSRSSTPQTPQEYPHLISFSRYQNLNPRAPPFC